MAYHKLRIAPAVSTGMNQGDKGPLERKADKRINFASLGDSEAFRHETDTAAPINPNRPNPTLIPE